MTLPDTQKQRPSSEKGATFVEAVLLTLFLSISLSAIASQLGRHAHSAADNLQQALLIGGGTEANTRGGQEKRCDPVMRNGGLFFPCGQLATPEIPGPGSSPSTQQQGRGRTQP